MIDQTANALGFLFKIIFSWESLISRDVDITISVQRGNLKSQVQNLGVVNHAERIVLVGMHFSCIYERGTFLQHDMIILGM